MNNSELSIQHSAFVTSSSLTAYKLYNIGNSTQLPLMTFIGTIQDVLSKKVEKYSCLCKMVM
ncbi:MAG: hypothetical protein Q9M34_07910 [Sulfurimonas sp.]|nr:hypothetical protein [Sulfurimonas sp.]